MNTDITRNYVVLLVPDTDYMGNKVDNKPAINQLGSGMNKSFGGVQLSFTPSLYGNIEGECTTCLKSFYPGNRSAELAQMIMLHTLYGVKLRQEAISIEIDGAFVCVNTDLEKMEVLTNP